MQTVVFSPTSNETKLRIYHSKYNKFFCKVYLNIIRYVYLILVYNIEFFIPIVIENGLLALSKPIASFGKLHFFPKCKKLQKAVNGKQETKLVYNSVYVKAQFAFRSNSNFFLFRAPTKLKINCTSYAVMVFTS